MYVLSCCSTVDLSLAHIQARNIHYVPFHYMLDNKSYDDDLFTSMTPQTFYAAMADGCDTRTSQVNVDEFITFFTPFLQEGNDIFHLSFSSGLSGTYNSACVAMNMLKEEYPERKIIVVDSLAASSGYGLLLDRVADLRDEGMSMEDLQQWIEKNRLSVNHWFYSTDLTFYVKGGRVSKTAGFFGNMLNICPLLNVNNEGHLIPRAKIRGKKKVLAEIVSRMESLARDGYDYDGKCYISHSNFIEDAQAVAQLIEQKFPKLNGKVLINPIGPTIGSHAGPGTVALFFFGKNREE